MGEQELSALPANVVAFKLPKRKPKVVEKVAPPDQRKMAIVPLRAIRDRQISDSQLRCLAVLCSYANRAGLTWVGQARLGQDLGVSKQSISKQIKRLVELGYLEVLSKGFRGEKANTIRVIYDPEIKAEDAIAVTSSQEDTRPPEVRKREAKAMTMQSEPSTFNQQGDPEFTEEEMAANRARLKAMLGGLGKRDGTFHYNRPETIGEMMARKTIKDAPKRQPKKASHSQPNTVDNEDTIHSQLHSQPNRVDQTQKNIGIDKVLSIYKDISNHRFSYVRTTSEVDLKYAALLCEVKVTEGEWVKACQSMTKDESLAHVADHLINSR